MCWITCCPRGGGRRPAARSGERMSDRPSRRRLDQPRTPGFRFSFDPESFGRFSERLARFLGTGKFLFWQTLLVVMWIAVNLTAASLRWDPYPFILLNL